MSPYLGTKVCPMTKEKGAGKEGTRQYGFELTVRCNPVQHPARIGASERAMREGFSRFQFDVLPSSIWQKCRWWDSNPHGTMPTGSLIQRVYQLRHTDVAMTPEGDQQ